MPTENTNFTSEVVAWYYGLPPVTRFLFSAVVIVSAFGNLVSPMPLFYRSALAIWKAEIWRLVTCFFFVKFGFGMILQLYFLYNYSIGIETSYFSGRTADYIYYLFICWGLLLSFATLFHSFFLFDALVMCIVYIWSRVNEDTTVTFMFGLRFKAKFLPMVLIGFEVLSDNFSISSIYSVLIAHTYWYLQETARDRGSGDAASTGDRRFFKPPAILLKYFPSETLGLNKSSKPSATDTLHSWGSGRRLGE